MLNQRFKLETMKNYILPLLKKIYKHKIKQTHDRKIEIQRNSWKKIILKINKYSFENITYKINNCKKPNIIKDKEA